MEECDYLELPQRINALLHCVCLVWVYCEHYRHPARLVVLMQETSNLVVELVSACVW